MEEESNETKWGKKPQISPWPETYWCVRLTHGPEGNHLGSLSTVIVLQP